MTFTTTQLDTQAIKYAKALAGDMVENAGHGHPGTPVSLAGAAYLLYQHIMCLDPQDPKWLGRDRFVLSAGHASALQYIQLFLAGFDVSLDDLRHFRQPGGICTGHPEYGVVPGVEVTTGPLGTGVAAGVGMAMEQRRLRGMLDPDAPAGQSPFDHQVYVVTGDGCLQEGLAYEAISLAGTQELGNLVLLYDENRISIEDDIDVAFTEDVPARFEAMGWHVQCVDWLRGDGSYVEDLESLDRAFAAARAETGRPSLIKLRTIIAWPTPGKQNTGGSHGAKLGTDALSGLKTALGLDPQQSFAFDPGVLAEVQQASLRRGARARADWDRRFTAWQQSHPSQAALLRRLQSGELPADIEDLLPHFEAGKDIATRQASGMVINALAPALPELWGGSADLAGSNNTAIKGAKSFIPTDRVSKVWSADPLQGRNLHFGVREHAMAGILNGIATSGLTRPYGGTFFVFSDFMRGAVRLSALMNLPVTYIWTHDSVGVGEDGPTHQPVETLATWRALPRFSVVRPADAEETAWAWLEILRRRGAAGLVLSRQNLPNPGREESGLAPASLVSSGGYVLRELVAPGKDLQVLLLATGSEVSLALSAAQMLFEQGIGVRVVNLPCLEWFEEQSQEYRDSVLPPQVRARVSVEAGVAMPWYRYLGSAGRALSIEDFGVPLGGAAAFQHFGFTPENLVALAKESLEAAQEASTAATTPIA